HGPPVCPRSADARIIEQNDQARSGTHGWRRAPSHRVVEVDDALDLAARIEGEVQIAGAELSRSARPKGCHVAYMSQPRPAGCVRCQEVFRGLGAGKTAT